MISVPTGRRAGRLRVLFVGIPDSIHAARWIRSLDDAPIDRSFFPTSIEGVHPLLLEAQRAANPIRVVRLEPAGRSALGERIGDRLLTTRGWSRAAPGRLRDKATATVAHHLPGGWRAALLATVVRAGKFDVVHTLETQGAGYLYQDALRSVLKRPLWIHSNYGSDTSLYARLPDHRARLVELLGHIDVHLAECCRDQRHVVELGFRGRCEDALPNGGGLDLVAAARLRTGPPSTRKWIAIKGNQGWAGRGLVALEALRRVSAALATSSIKVYSAEGPVTLASRLLAADTGLDIEVVPPASQEAQLALHGRARVSVGLSISDAASTSFLEALAMGSFPIQSDSACLDEWIEPGVTGLAVPAEDPGALAAAITRAWTEDALVDHAAVVNDVTAATRLDARLLRPRIAAIYQRAAGQLGLPQW